jgi:deoxycytidylate deaminase
MPRKFKRPFRKCAQSDAFGLVCTAERECDGTWSSFVDECFKWSKYMCFESNSPQSTYERALEIAAESDYLPEAIRNGAQVDQMVNEEDPCI